MSKPCAGCGRCDAPLYGDGDGGLCLQCLGDGLVNVLQQIIRADDTHYEHHQPRRWDGRAPEGGTIWLTPREIATRALGSLGAKAPDAIEETLGKMRP